MWEQAINFERGFLLKEPVYLYSLLSFFHRDAGEEQIIYLVISLREIIGLKLN